MEGGVNRSVNINMSSAGASTPGSDRAERRRADGVSQRTKPHPSTALTHPA